MKTLNDILAKFGKRRWLTVPAGLAVSTISAFALFALFMMKGYSSQVRDAYEAPAGLPQYILFAVVCVVLSSSIVCGLWVAVLGARKSRGI